MEQAWELEAALWAATTTGEVAEFYAHTLSDDANIIVPGHLLRRDEIVGQFVDNDLPWTNYEISDREILVNTKELIVLAYRLATWGPAMPDVYTAWVTTIYRWTSRGWALALRQHTPDPGVETGTWVPDTFAATEHAGEPGGPASL